jgi:DNA-binding NarL/FixJ family response regulator
VLVHSGFDASTMRDRVIALGAARYLEKGGNLRDVREAVREVMDRPA